jgi:hypothetical protein
MTTRVSWVITCEIVSQFFKYSRNALRAIEDTSSHARARRAREEHRAVLAPNLTDSNARRARAQRRASSTAAQRVVDVVAMVGLAR